MKPLFNRERGFTIVEMGIVLVIIGLILGGILGGQSVIRGARVNDAITIAEDLRAAAAYFRQRYHYLPGDLPAPQNDIAATPALVEGTGGTIGNGTIEGAINAAGLATVGSEVAEAPWQMFNAGFLGKVDGNPQRRVSTAFGPVHIVATTGAGVGAFTGFNPRNVILFVDLPCDVAEEIDRKLDDGSLTTGRAIGNNAACPNGVVNRYAIAL